jgi:hypothetical protein
MCISCVVYAPSETCFRGACRNTRNSPLMFKKQPANSRKWRVSICHGNKETGNRRAEEHQKKNKITVPFRLNAPTPRRKKTRLKKEMMGQSFVGNVMRVNCQRVRCMRVMAGSSRVLPGWTSCLARLRHPRALVGLEAASLILVSRPGSQEYLRASCCQGSWSG